MATSMPASSRKVDVDSGNGSRRLWRQRLWRQQLWRQRLLAAALAAAALAVAPAVVLVAFVENARMAIGLPLRLDTRLF